MNAQVQVLTRSNQSVYANVYCDECRWDWQADPNARPLTETEATELAQFHNECHHS